jgi:hypothetical protein
LLLVNALQFIKLLLEESSQAGGSTETTIAHQPISLTFSLLSQVR